MGIDYKPPYDKREKKLLASPFLLVVSAIGIVTATALLVML